MQDAQGLSRQNGDVILRFLLEMDRKLDAIMAMLQRESLAADFPMQGHIVELGGEGLVLRCEERLEESAHLEILLQPDPPLRMMSVMAQVQGLHGARGAAAGDYNATYTCLSEYDRDAMIGFIFSEERKRIREKKETGK